MQITPAIAPIIAPNKMSFNKLKLKTNEPSRIEKTINARIVNKIPITAPQSQPLVFIFLPNTKDPKSMLSALITWFMG